MTKKIEGQLEIDADRGVVYFHQNTGGTKLRICKIPSVLLKQDFIDFSYGQIDVELSQLLKNKELLGSKD